MNTAAIEQEVMEDDQATQEDTSKVLDVRLHQINHDLKKAVPIDVSSANADLQSYLALLRKSINEQQEKRSYLFASDTTEFNSSLSDFFMSETLEGRSNALAHRLLLKEMSTEESYGHLAGGRERLLNKGSFLQFLFTSDGLVSYLGVKIEHESFLDENDLKRKSGLPEKSRIYKACMVNFDENGNRLEALVFETKKSRYWWDGFLELQMKIGDEENTQRAVKAVIKVLNRRVKEKFPADYTELRNIVVGEFKKKGRMNYYEFINNLFERYEYKDPGLVTEVPGILKKLREAPKSPTQGFDTQFDLVPKAVPFRQVKINLTPEVELIYSDGMTNISDVIWSEETNEGKKLVVIHSPVGFSRFEKKLRT